MIFIKKKKGSVFNLKVGLISLVVIAFLLLNISPFSAKIRSFFYSVSQPFQTWLWEKGRYTRELGKIILNMKTLNQQNEDLKKENQDLFVKLIELEGLREENQFLRTALGLGLEKEFDLVLLQILGKEVSRDYLIIDKGSRQGIGFGYPVITEQKVLVGKVIQVYENTSKVQLLTSKDSSFDVKILGRETYGLAKGEGNFQLILDLIPREKEIEVADKVVTTTLGGNFPERLLVGEVENIKRSDVSSFQEAEIRPAFNISEADYLFVITNLNI